MLETEVAVIHIGALGRPGGDQLLHSAAAVRARFHNAGIYLECAGRVLEIAPGSPNSRIRAFPQDLVAGSPPLQELLRIAVAHGLATKGVVLLHAASFGLAGRNFVALGKSGGGKSTLAVAAVKVGGCVVCDDEIAISIAESGRPVVRAFRQELRLRPNSARLLPEGIKGTRVRGTSQGTRVLVVSNDCLGRGSVKMLAPDTILVLSVDRRLKRCSVASLKSGEALAALIYACMPAYMGPFLVAERAAMISTLRVAAESCPAFRVRLGRRLLEEPEDEMRRLLELTRG